MDAEDISLTAEDSTAALDREDGLGMLVSRAFSFKIPDFCDIMAGDSRCAPKKEAV